MLALGFQRVAVDAHLLALRPGRAKGEFWLFFNPFDALAHGEDEDRSVGVHADISTRNVGVDSLPRACRRADAPRSRECPDGATRPTLSRERRVRRHREALPRPDRGGEP